MKYNRKRNPQKNSNILFYFFTVILLFIIAFLNIGFSAFQNDLAIKDISANVRIDKDVRVMNINIDNVSEATSYYEDYNVANISGSISLNNKNSYVIYNVDVYNLGNVPMGIAEATIDNANLKFDFINYNLKDKICENNQCSLGVKKRLKIKISYKENASVSNEAENFVLAFKFRRIYNVDYINISNNNDLPKEVIEGDTLNLNIYNTSDSNLLIYMNNKRLSINSEYQYNNEILIIPNINGDIRIKLNKYICKRAIKLHEEVCDYKDNYYCRKIVAKIGDSIAYGNIGTTGILTNGDAFDCDVNGDGIYDSDTERFYFVSDYYNTTTKEFEEDTAVLIYYNNINAGQPDLNKRYIYDASSNNKGPTEAIKGLPTVSQWPNVKLKNSIRNIVSDENDNKTEAGILPSDFSYEGYSARLLTLQELRKGTGKNNIPTNKNNELLNYPYLLENTVFAQNQSKIWAWWLETPRSINSIHVWGPHGSHIALHDLTVTNAEPYGVRPAIDVAKANIDY